MYTPSCKKATEPNQIKSSNSKGSESDISTPDPLLGDPIGKTKKNTMKPKVTEPITKLNEDDVRIYEFVFEGLPNLPDLEGMDEDRFIELERNVQEQL